MMKVIELIADVNISGQDNPREHSLRHPTTGTANALSPMAVATVIGIFRRLVFFGGVLCETLRGALGNPSLSKRPTGGVYRC
jgi:hypothetical protein